MKNKTEDHVCDYRMSIWSVFTQCIYCGKQLDLESDDGKQYLKYMEKIDKEYISAVVLVLILGVVITTVIQLLRSF